MKEIQMIQALRKANAVAAQAKEEGHHPFGAVLISSDGETVLMEQGNIDTVRHAETELVRAAAAKFAPEYLWSCTLVTNVEPCVMCTGTIYWSNIGRIVYGVKESVLLKLTGNHVENPTLDLPCREVLRAGQKQIQVYGPFEEVEDEIIELHRDMWN